MTMDMLSRVVDSLFWMSRYLERAEHTSRMLDVYLNLMLDLAPGMSEQQRLRHLMESMGAVTTAVTTIEEFAEQEDFLYWMTFDSTNSQSITANITAARENARQVREQISSEMWTQINQLYLHNRRTNIDSWRIAPHDFYLEVKDGAHLFQGITDATMNHDQGWHFIQIGRYIERAFSLLQLLNTNFGTINLHEIGDLAQVDYFELVATLKSVSAFEAYCKVYNPNLQTKSIIEFLLFNEHFPRSLRFCVDTSLASLHALGDSTKRSKNTRLYRTAGRLQSSLSYDELIDIDDLQVYIKTIRKQIFQIHDMLYDTFITYPIETAL